MEANETGQDEVMAEQTEQPQQKPARGRFVTIGLVAGVAVIEAVGFLVFMKFFGGAPEPAYGQPGQHAIVPENTAVQTLEVPIVSHFRVPNAAKGVTYIYDFDISAVVAAERKDEVQKLVAARAGEISDRIAQIVRGANARVLDEVDFKTLRLQLHQALKEALGRDGLVERVLIPRCVPIRTD